jgi:hypothetical protein
MAKITNKMNLFFNFSQGKGKEEGYQGHPVRIGRFAASG